MNGFKLLVSALLVISTLLCGCSARQAQRNSHPTEDGDDQPPVSADQQAANIRFEKLLAALQNRDSEAIRALFSDKAISKAENFDQSARVLFEYFQGEYVSHKDCALSTMTGYNDDGSGRSYTEAFPGYEVTTSEHVYRFDIAEFTAYSPDRDMVGVWALYIYDADDVVNPEAWYVGHGRETPGINFPTRDVRPNRSILLERLAGM